MSYSCNDNQNYFVSETGRTTSRVLNPPGGASSFSLGSDDATASSKKKSSPPKPPASEVQKSIQDEGTAAPSVVANQGSEGARYASFPLELASSLVLTRSTALIPGMPGSFQFFLIPSCSCLICFFMCFVRCRRSFNFC